VRHRRFGPTENTFRYSVFMTLLDLAELDEVFRGRWFWSAHRPALAWFRREDHLGDPAVPLDTTVRDLVEAETGRRPAGPIRLLTNLRFFGYVINPISVYYCFDEADQQLDTVVLEVHNTPWGEIHPYVLGAPEPDARGAALAYHFTKAMHVSPFMDMDMEYRCRITPPGKQIVLHLENWQDGNCLFDATMTLARREMDGNALAAALFRHPFMTWKVAAGIYFQALRLWLKGTPFFPHPGGKTG
jgi:DUF1365 family protein